MQNIQSILVSLSLVPGFLFGQTKSFGFEFIGRRDQQVNYETNYAGRVYSDRLKLWGTSFGVNSFLKKDIKQSYTIRLAVGYYRLNIDKIRGSVPFNIPGESTARNINYPSPVNILYSTNRYHYNNLSLHIGFSKQFSLKKTQMELGTEFIGYHTLSQKYLIIQQSKYYSTKNRQPWSYGFNLNFGVIKPLGKYYLEPIVVVPLFQRLRGDRVFYEDTNMNIDKWLNGLGLSLRVGRNL